MSVRRGLAALAGWCLVPGLTVALVPQTVSAATNAAALRAISLQAGDVPAGYAAVDPSVETINNANDYGESQAFIQCARGHVLLDQFDQGQDAYNSVFYGQGENPYGTPILNLVSVVFGDGSVGDAQTAEAELTSLSFQHCWASTTDTLNREQGITIPIYPSTVQQLPNPHLGSRSAAFAINSRYSVEGSPVNFQWAEQVVQTGPFVVMLIGLAYDEQFPAAQQLSSLRHMVSRAAEQGAGAGGPARGCVSGQLLDGQVPVLTAAQVSADVRQPVTLLSSTPGPVVSCSWVGAKEPPDKRDVYRPYTVQVWFGLQFLTTTAEAQAAAKQDEAVAGPPRPVGGLAGATAVVMPGQDEVTRQLVAYTRGDEVFSIELGSPAKSATQTAYLVAIAHQVLQRLAYVPVPSCTPTIRSVSAVLPQDNQTITISGSCLGTAPAGNGDTPFLRVVQSDGNGDPAAWNACSKLDPGGDTDHCDISSWTNTQVVLSAIRPGSCLPPEAAGPPGPGCDQLLFQTGDSIMVQLWNPQSGKGPALYRTQVTVGVNVYGTDYQNGEQLASEINQHHQGGDPVGGFWYVLPLCLAESCANSAVAQYITEIKADRTSPIFDAALLSHLNQEAQISLLQYFQYGGPDPDQVVETLALMAANAYSTGAAPASFAQLLYDRMGTGANGNASQLLDAQLAAALANNPQGATYFFSALPGNDITTWSQNDQGLETTARCSTQNGTVAVQCFQQAALAVVNNNLMGYADWPDYPGPLSPQQLGQTMYAAERDPYGEEQATNFIAPWFIRYGGQPDGSNSLSVLLWALPLVNLNGAVASPTGAYIQNAQDWLNAGWFAAKTLGGLGISLLLAPVVPFMAGLLVEGPVFDALNTAGFLEAINEANDVVEIQTAMLKAAMEAGEIAELDTRLVEGIYDIYDLTKTILGVEGDFSKIIGGNSGVAHETRYYLTIMVNTFHEAVARLIQLHLLLGPDGNQINTASSKQIGNIAYHPAGYTIRGGTSLKLVWGTIAAVFMSTH